MIEYITILMVTGIPVYPSLWLVSFFFFRGKKCAHAFKKSSVLSLYMIGFYYFSLFCLTLISATTAIALAWMAAFLAVTMMPVLLIHLLIATSNNIASGSCSPRESQVIEPGREVQETD